ncbi:conserved hypothetical protein [Hoeflea sp. EC-HK425]|nr:conserved hypothetical protein [Hoeflea sp. EC-HK425]
MSCSATCSRESESLFPDVSPGVVEGDEDVSRAAFSPFHFKKAGGLKNSFVKSSDLKKGDLSVWRLRYCANELEEILSSSCPAGSELHSAYPCTASAIRGQRIEGHEGRVFCVVDDCRIDSDGNVHSAHAAIGIACELNPQDLDTESPQFLLIRDLLVNLFKSRQPQTF